MNEDGNVHGYVTSNLLFVCDTYGMVFIGKRYDGGKGYEGYGYIFIRRRK